MRDEQSALEQVVDFFFNVEVEELDSQHGADSLVLILSNCPPDEADAIARTLVEERLAACVNIMPGVRSFYIWKGQYTEDSESTLLIKGIESRVDRLVARLRELHSAQTPEIVMLKPHGVDTKYLNWAREAVQ